MKTYPVNLDDCGPMVLDALIKIKNEQVCFPGEYHSHECPRRLTLDVAVVQVFSMVSRSASTCSMRGG